MINKITYFNNDQDDQFINIFFQRNQSKNKVKNIIWNINQDDIVKEGQILGQIQLDTSELFIKSSYYGQISYMGLEIQNKINDQSSTLLMSLKICDHIVNDVEKFPKKCQICQQNVYMYFEQNETIYTPKMIQQDKICVKIWKVKLNEKININTLIAITQNDVEVYSPIYGKITQKAQIGQTFQENDFLFKCRKSICSHQEIINNECQMCGLYIILQKQNKSYVGLNEQIYYGDQLAWEYTSQKLNNLIKVQNKLFLILDIDNTILHTMLHYKYMSYENNDDVVVVDDIGSPKSLSLFVKLRDNLLEFLNQIFELYEIYIFTLGTKQYALQMIKMIKKKYLEKFQIEANFLDNDRILSRQLIQNDNYQKSLEKIFPKGAEKYMIILDDRVDVWLSSSHDQNIVFTKPYYYWKENKHYEQENKNKQNLIKKELQDLNKIQKKIKLNDENGDKGDVALVAGDKAQVAIDDNVPQVVNQEVPQIQQNYIHVHRKNDCYLLYTIKVLKTLQEQYFIQNNNNNQLPDIREIYQIYRKSILLDFKICFSGILLKNQTKEQNYYYQKAYYMGATILSQIDDIKPDILLVGDKNQSTLKFKQCKELKIPVVHIEYISYCYILNQKIDFDIFIIDGKDSQYFKNYDQIERLLQEKLILK